MEKEPARRPLNANAVADSLRLIKEKIETQRSAGVDSAKKRKIDRTGTDKKLDDDDKTAARILLGKKKKKEAPTPFYAKGLFTVAALFVIACIALAGIYFVFLRTPSAESLYARVAAVMKSENADDRKAAREGPVADFLRYYPTHEKTALVQAFADQYDFELLDGQMHRRRNKGWKVEGKDAAEEQSARDALGEEDIGKLPDALKRWTELSKKKGNADPDFHAWGLVGERYGKKLQEVVDRHGQLRTKIYTERLSGKPAVADHDNANEKIALHAVRAEVAAEKTKAPDDPEPLLKKAREQWDELKKATDKDDPQQRYWHLLAAWRYRELKKS
jgi:hypothetical protein